MKSGTWSGSNEFTVTLKSGKTTGAEVTAVLCFDNDYGADADGNRGMPATFLEELDWETPTVDDEGYTLSPKERHEADSLLSKVAEDHDWETQAAEEYASSRADSYDYYHY
jgi:hypothetical protein